MLGAGRLRLAAGTWYGGCNSGNGAVAVQVTGAATDASTVTGGGAIDAAATVACSEDAVGRPPHDRHRVRGRCTVRQYYFILLLLLSGNKNYGRVAARRKRWWLNDRDDDDDDYGSVNNDIITCIIII